MATTTRTFTTRTFPSSKAVFVTQDGVFHRLRFWSEEEWEALPPECRPELAEHVPGLCWVGAVRVDDLN
jgi:hypothetical protein